MASIKNLNNMTVDQLNYELSNGGKFVAFEYCISIIFMSFKRSGAIHFIRKGESTFKFHIGLTLVSLLFGWWGFPWGLIYTPMAIFTNLSGGKDVRGDVLAAMNGNGNNA